MVRFRQSCSKTKECGLYSAVAPQPPFFSTGSMGTEIFSKVGLVNCLSSSFAWKIGTHETMGEVWKWGLQGRTSPYPFSRLVPLPPSLIPDTKWANIMLHPNDSWSHFRPHCKLYNRPHYANCNMCLFLSNFHPHFKYINTTQITTCVYSYLILHTVHFVTLTYKFWSSIVLKAYVSVEISIHVYFKKSPWVTSLL